MTDHSTARALVEKLRRGCSCGKCKHDACCCQTMEEAADFIEQALTPPEGDTLPSTVAAMLAEWVENGCEEVPQDLASRITALQSRVSPQGLIEALEEARAFANDPLLSAYYQEERTRRIEALNAKIDAALSASRMSEAMSRPIPKEDALAKLVQDAYEEGVEDGDEWRADPRGEPKPQWIDSVARVELLRAMSAARLEPRHDD